MSAEFIIAETIRDLERDGYHTVLEATSIDRAATNYIEAYGYSDEALDLFVKDYVGTVYYVTARRRAYYETAWSEVDEQQGVPPLIGKKGDRLCSFCSETVQGNWDYCPNCGTKIDWRL